MKLKGGEQNYIPDRVFEEQLYYGCVDIIAMIFKKENVRVSACFVERFE